MNSCAVVHKHIGKSFEFRGLLNQLTGSARELFKSSSAGWTVPKLHGWSTFHVVFLHVLHSIRLDASMLRLAGAKIPDLATALQVMLKGHEKCNVHPISMLSVYYRVVRLVRLPATSE